MRQLICLAAVMVVTASCSDDTCEDSSCAAPMGGAGGVGPVAGMTSAGGEAQVGGNEGGGPQLEGGSGGAGGAAATMTQITVVEYSGQPGIGLDVIANAEDGTLVDNGITDADGTVDLSVPSGGIVSLLYTQTFLPPELYTTRRIVETAHFDGAAPDSLAFTAFFPDYAESTEAMNQMVLWGPVPGATSYKISASCWAATTTDASYAKIGAPGCTKDGLYDILVVALDPGGIALDFAHVDGQAFADGTAALHPLTWANEPIDTVDVQIVNIPSGSPEGYLMSSSYRQREGGYGVGFGGSEAFNDPGSTILATFQHIAQYGDRHCQEAVVSLAQPGSFSSNYRVRCKAVADLTPLVLDPTRLSRYQPLGDALGPTTLAWEQSFAKETGDVLIVSETWGHAAEQTVWSNYLAPAEGQTPFPELPGFLSVYAFGDEDVLSALEARHFDFIGVAGFDEAVALGGIPSVTLRDFDSYYAAADP